MSRRSIPVVAFLLGLTCSTAAQQSAHVHGIATLNLAIEGNEFEIEFVSPAGNLVGFEHKAVTAAERRAIRDAIEQLRKGNELFDLSPEASCSLTVADVKHRHQGEEDVTDGHGHGAKHDDHAEHEHAGEEEDGTHSGHEEEKREDEHDEHEHAGEEEDGTHSGPDAKHDDGDEHGRAGKAGDTHSEFHAHYHYVCNGSRIGTIGVRLFEHWPRIKEIRVQALTPTGQFGGDVKADDPVIRLR